MVARAADTGAVEDTGAVSIAAEKGYLRELGNLLFHLSLLGLLVAMAVGLVALKLLLGWLQAGKLAFFAYYLIPLGAAVTAWQLSGWRTG